MHVAFRGFKIKLRLAPYFSSESTLYSLLSYPFLQWDFHLIRKITRSHFYLQDILSDLQGSFRYEAITFSFSFFLAHICSYFCDVQHYQGDISELELYFVIVNNEYGEQTEEELLPGGRNIRVTNENVITFIHLVSNHRLNFQVFQPCIFQFIYIPFLSHLLSSFIFM